VEEILGVVEFDCIDRYIRAIIQHDLPGILSIIQDIIDRGQDINWFVRECLLYLRNLAVMIVSPNNTELLDLPDDYRRQLHETSQLTALEQILYITDVFWATEQRMRTSSEARIVLEISSIKAAKAGQAVRIKDLLQKLSQVSGSSSPIVQNQGSVEHSPLFSAPEPASASPKPAASPENPLPEHNPSEPAPEAPQPAPQKNTAPAGIDLFSSSWQQALKKLEEQYPILAACLQHSRPLDVDEKTLKVAIPTQNALFCQRLEKMESRQILSEFFLGIFGKKLTLAYELRDGLMQDPDVDTGESAPAKPALSRQELMESIQQDKMFNKLMDEIPGHITSVDPL
jgi:DNA polymerase III gamma/tau subunit